MSKDKIQLFSPLFLKYQADYEKNPRSRVFAPLAEIYRKLGMADKAMEILAQGIRYHPTYTMGYLGLAFCYYDLKQFSLVYNTLRPLVENNRDNIRLQKICADTCLQLGYKEEALDTYKYLLFISPRDKDVALQVSMLENLIENQYRPVHQPIHIPESEFKSEPRRDRETQGFKMFDTDKLDNKPLADKEDFDDWMAVDLSKDQKKSDSEKHYDAWNVKKGALSDETPVVTEKAEPKATHEEISIVFSVDEAEDIEETKAATPLVTHTLVDLYCGQGHIEKALEVLEKILLLNPSDQKTINKIAEIKDLMKPFEDDAPSLVIDKDEDENEEVILPLSQFNKKTVEETSEEDGRKNLMSIFDQQIKNVEILEEILPKTSNRKLIIEEKLTAFLKKIQKRALDYQARV